MYLKNYKRICIVTDSWKPQLSGVVTTLEQTIACLKKEYAVDLIEPSQFHGVRADRFVRGLKLAIPPYNMKKRLSGAGAIHIATEGPLGWAAKLYCDQRLIPYSTAYHTNFPAYMHMNWRIPEKLTYAYIRKFHEKSAGVMVPTQSIMNELAANGVTNTKLWSRGVDDAVFNPNAPIVPLVYPGPEGYAENWQKIFPRPYYLSVGRISKEKNLEAFLDLDLPGTKIVVGDGPDLARLKNIYGQWHDTLFFGKRVGAELASAYRLADVFVFTSRFDTFGLVNAEAIACGTPVAAFPVAGPIDIVEQGVTGFCDNNLAVACHKALGLKGTFVRDFSWEAATDQFVDSLVFRP